MSLRNLLSVGNIVFLIGGVYFFALVVLNESTAYSLIPAVLCFIGFGLGVRDEWILSNPWRTATAVLVIVLLVVQEAANLEVQTLTDYYTLSSIVVNGIILILFLGLLLYSLKNLVNAESEEEEENARPSKRQSVLQ